MTTIIDRRLNPRDKAIKNRRKFINRSKANIKQAVKEAIDSGNIADIEKGKIRIKAKGISEPTFNTDHRTGDKEYVLPGNKEFVVGDKRDRPPGSSRGSGVNAGNSGPEKDDFDFVLSSGEYLNFIFEDLELPNMVKKQIKDVTKFNLSRSGFKNFGNPSQLDIVRSLTKGMGRRIGVKRPKTSEIEEWEEKLRVYKDIYANSSYPDDSIKSKIEEIEEHLTRLKSRQKAIPWLDPTDMRYRNFKLTPKPMSQAVMFCIMDVSGSMGKAEKDAAKRFFFLLHMFLSRKYDKVSIRFIRHTEEAEEVDENTFFNDHKSGGTIVSTAIQLVKDIVKKDYDLNSWNVYCAQVSDGDNSSNDSAETLSLMHELLPMVQYFAYTEVKLSQNFFYTGISDLWKTYEYAAHTHKNIKSKKIFDSSDIWKVFKELFAKENSSGKK